MKTSSVPQPKTKARTKSKPDLFGPACRAWERDVKKKHGSDAMFYLFTNGMTLVAYHQRTGDRLGEFSCSPQHVVAPVKHVTTKPKRGGRR